LRGNGLRNRGTTLKKIEIGLSFLLGSIFFTAALSASAADDPLPQASASAAPAAREVQIPFADRTLWNWQVVDDHTVLIQDRGRKWYKATLHAPCFNLPFTQELGFEPNPTGTFDKFSSIRVREQRCPLISLVESTAPPKKSKGKSPDPAAASH
jgi:hypothetical protein